MAVNRHITGSAQQGDNFTAGKFPTITLERRKKHVWLSGRMHIRIEQRAAASVKA